MGVHEVCGDFLPDEWRRYNIRRIGAWEKWPNARFEKNNNINIELLSLRFL